MNKKDQKKVDDLGKVMDEFMKSGLSVTEFMKEHIFKEYSEDGDKKLEDIAAQYFIDHLK